MPEKWMDENQYPTFLLTEGYNEIQLMYSYVCKRSIRPRNINWQDWKYTYFEIFVCFSQNIQRHSGMGGEYFVADVVENMIEIPIKVLIFFY